MRYIFLAVATALTVLCSCSKQDAEIEKLSTGGIINISFVEEPPMTRSFFSTTATAETWEKALNSITLFAFNSSGGLIIQRSFSTGELTSKKASFALPGVAPGTTCDFYAVANLTISNINNKAALLDVLESSSAAYNGTFAEVSAGAKRSEGFVMSGMTTKAIAVANSPTNVEIPLKRTVAKLAVEITPSASFSAVYPGAIRVNSVTIKKAASQTPVIKPAIAVSGAMTATVSQNANVSSGKYQNIFYLFENGNLSVGSRVMATINAIYDADKNFSTTADQTPVSYDVELTGDSAGSLTRNGYYRMVVNLNGLAGSDCTMTVVVADWETPVTQTINVGI